MMLRSDELGASKSVQDPFELMSMIKSCLCKILENREN